jgi:hypothetical protein
MPPEVYHAAEILLVAGSFDMPAGATPEFSAKTIAEDSLSCSEVTGDYTLDAISRSTEILFNGTYCSLF